MTLADVTGYSAKDRAPVCGQYRGYRLCGIGPPVQGGVAVLQILGMLERFDLKAPAPDDPVTWHLSPKHSASPMPRSRAVPGEQFIQRPNRG